MTAYTQLAQVYDQLMGQEPYDQWMEFVDKALGRWSKRPQLVLELACGTGSLTYRLCQAGFEVIAMDVSPDMLSVAREKCAQFATPPVLLCQDMTELDLYGTVDAVFCGLDSLNYLTSYGDLCKALSRVALFLNPGGLFLFDVKPPQAFAQMAGTACCQELASVFCTWQYDYEESTGNAQHQVDLFFEEADDSYQRFSEEHSQRAFSTQELTEALDQCGLAVRAIWGEEDQRLYFVAQKA